jgi:hypothetical protein
MPPVNRAEGDAAIILVGQGGAEEGREGGRGREEVGWKV